MKDLDDIKYAVLSENGNIVGFFQDEDIAKDFAEMMEARGEHYVLSDDDFYIHIYTSVISSFNVRG
jgi:hypothetical protein